MPEVRLSLLYRCQNARGGAWPSPAWAVSGLESVGYGEGPPDTLQRLLQGELCQAVSGGLKLAVASMHVLRKLQIHGADLVVPNQQVSGSSPLIGSIHLIDYKKPNGNILRCLKWSKGDLGRYRVNLDCNLTGLGGTSEAHLS